jgi:hypothetical protein
MPAFVAGGVKWKRMGTHGQDVCTQTKMPTITKVATDEG